MSVSWPLAVFIVAPFAVPLAVVVYLLVRYPKPYFVAIPFLFLAVPVAVFVTERRFRHHTYRVVAGSYFLFETYLATVGALYVGSATFAVVVLVLGLIATALVVWKGADRLREGIPWGQPHDPGDRRWTSPF